MVLDMIYRGAFRPAEQVVPREAEYMDTRMKISSLRSQLESKLGEEGCERLEEYSSQVAFANGMENKCHFKCGFASGVDLMLDLSKCMNKEN